MNKYRRISYLILSGLILSMASCHALLLSKKKLKIDDSIVGIWKISDDERSADKYEIVKINDYLAHAYDLSEGIGTEESLIKITIHKIASYQFMCIQESDGKVTTLHFLRESTGQFSLYPFKLNATYIEGSIYEIKNNELKEFIFAKAVEEYGIGFTEDDKITLRKIYGPIGN